jgi:hypothetical protein
MGVYAATQFNSMAISADAGSAATSSIFRNSVQLWDLASGQIVCDFESERSGVGSFGLAFTYRGDRLATAGPSKLINI